MDREKRHRSGGFEAQPDVFSVDGPDLTSSGRCFSGECLYKLTLIGFGDRPEKGPAIQIVDSLRDMYGSGNENMESPLVQFETAQSGFIEIYKQALSISIADIGFMAGMEIEVSANEKKFRKGNPDKILAVRKFLADMDLPEPERIVRKPGKGFGDLQIPNFVVVPDFRLGITTNPHDTKANMLIHKISILDASPLR